MHVRLDVLNLGRGLAFLPAIQTVSIESGIDADSADFTERFEVGVRDEGQ